jgi:hypothetical protein
VSIDLTAAIEAVAHTAHREWCNLPYCSYGCGDEEQARLYVTAAAPIIEAQVREQVTAEIEEERAECVATLDDQVMYDRGVLYGLAVAARIARGVTS